MVEIGPKMAKDSSEVTKFRKKIKERIAEQDKLVTPEALQDTAKITQHWLQRHESERVNLKDKTVIVESHSGYIKHLALAIKGQPGKSKPLPTLKGRITNP